MGDWSDKTELPKTSGGVDRHRPKQFPRLGQRFFRVKEDNAWVPRYHWLEAAERERIVAFGRHLRSDTSGVGRDANHARRAEPRADVRVAVQQLPQHVRHDADGGGGRAGGGGGK